MGDFLLVEVREIAVDGKHKNRQLREKRRCGWGTVVVEKQISPLRSSR
jgi:hypothetical protein